MRPSRVCDGQMSDAHARTHTHTHTYYDAYMGLETTAQKGGSGGGGVVRRCVRPTDRMDNSPRGTHGHPPPTRGVQSVASTACGRSVVRSARHCARASCVNTERGDAVRHEAIVRREESTRGAGEDAE